VAMMRPRVVSTIELSNWIAAEIDGLEIEPTLRNRLAGASFSIALDYHAGIGLLLHNNRAAPAFALARLLFEAYVRGRWLAECASDHELARIGVGGKLPLINSMLSALESKSPTDEQILTRSKEANWDALCGFTHTGGNHLQRYQTEGGIEANYQKDEIEEALSFSDAMALLAAVGIANLASGSELAGRLLEKSEQHISR
jgi:hypothetical protein